MKTFGVPFSSIVLTLSVVAVHAADALPPASDRFAQDKAAETPSFQRHVVPLMGRLGCNGRACHGSFQGQGGFRLSLFGYDFAADHAAVSKDNAAGGDEPRVDRKQPKNSLILQKPTLGVDHDGGKRMEVGSWQYRLLLRWIEAGCPPADEDAAAFITLDVTPREFVARRAGDTVALRAIARWADGSSEDVTPLCRFQTNDESVATVDEAGLVTLGGPGDTHVVAFYDNGVTPVQVILPVSERHGDRYPNVATPTRVDELVTDKLRKLGVEPSELCTDAEFLRRVSLDITGTLPTPDEVRTFLASKGKNKRAKKIDELLERPTYAAWWTTKLCDWMGNAEANGQVGGEQGLRRRCAEQWYDWTYRRVRDNMPYDKLCEGIILATSRTTEQSFEDYCAEMSGYFRKDNPRDFAARETMPYFWIRRPLGAADGKSLAFAYSFLGVRLECAQCHKHPYDQWTKQDFDQFAAFFNGVRHGTFGRDVPKAMKAGTGLDGMDEDNGDYKRLFVKLLEEGRVLPFKELTVPPPSNRAAQAKRKPNVKLGRVITPRLLGGDEEVLTYEYDDPRRPLMDWLRQDNNPYFARALVNRVWAGYFHIGIIDPPDDLSLANAPSNAALLDYLAEEFVAHQYDLKWLHRAIATSHAYQRSWRPNDTNATDERNFSHAIVRRLPGEVAYDALVTATTAGNLLKDRIDDEVTVRGRAIGVGSGWSGLREEFQYAGNLFGKPLRTINCDCERSSESSLLQTVYLQNDTEIFRQLDKRDGWLAELFPRGKSSGEPATAAWIEEAYLRTLSRLPTAEEKTIAAEYLSSAKDDRHGLRNLLWALLNTKEFILNH